MDKEYLDHGRVVFDLPQGVFDDLLFSIEEAAEKLGDKPIGLRLKVMASALRQIESNGKDRVAGVAKALRDVPDINDRAGVSVSILPLMKVRVFGHGQNQKNRLADAARKAGASIVDIAD